MITSACVINSLLGFSLVLQLTSPLLSCRAEGFFFWAYNLHLSRCLSSTDLSILFGSPDMHRIPPWRFCCVKMGRPPQSHSRQNASHKWQAIHTSSSPQRSQSKNWCTSSTCPKTSAGHISTILKRKNWLYLSLVVAEDSQHWLVQLNWLLFMIPPRFLGDLASDRTHACKVSWLTFECRNLIRSSSSTCRNQRIVLTRIYGGVERMVAIKA